MYLSYYLSYKAGEHTGSGNQAGCYACQWRIRGRPNVGPNSTHSVGGPLQPGRRARLRSNWCIASCTICMSRLARPGPSSSRWIRVDPRCAVLLRRQARAAGGNKPQ